MGGGVFGGEVVENVNEKIRSDLVKREEETKRRSGSAIFCSIFLLHPMSFYFTHFIEPPNLTWGLILNDFRPSNNSCAGWNYRSLY
jgi:hypothetical protein